MNLKDLNDFYSCIQRYAFLSFQKKSYRKSSSCSSTSKCFTSQLPKPVECIEVKNKDHYFVPPVKIDGKVVTNFQYLSLNDIGRFIDDECKFFLIYNKYCFLSCNKT